MQYDCRVVEIRELIADHLCSLSKLDAFVPDVPSKFEVAFVDWEDGSTASSKKIFLLTGGIIHDPKIFRESPFLEPVIEKRTPIITMLAGETPEIIEISQKILAEFYVSLIEPFTIQHKGKVLEISIVPAGGKDDHKAAWGKTGNLCGGHRRCPVCDVECVEEWKSFHACCQSHQKGY